MKICSKCKIKKPESEFFKSGKQRGKQYYKTTCKSCCQNYNKAKTRGLTHEEREKFLESRDFKCEICGMSREMSYEILNKDLVIDHCHSTNINKGVLCNVCNCGSGYFKDDVVLAHRLWRYLEKTRTIK
jgi:hypothetical protein